MVPVMIQMMLGADKKATEEGATPPHCSSLETVLYGAAPMPEALLKPAMAKFPKATFLQGYGMTETSPAICMLTGEHHTEGNHRMRSVGQPVSWVEARIVDSDDNELARNTPGEIV